MSSASRKSVIDNTGTTKNTHQRQVHASSRGFVMHQSGGELVLLVGRASDRPCEGQRSEICPTCVDGQHSGKQTSYGNRADSSV